MNLYNTLTKLSSKVLNDSDLIFAIWLVHSYKYLIVGLIKALILNTSKKVNYLFINHYRNNSFLYMVKKNHNQVLLINKLFVDIFDCIFTTKISKNIRYLFAHLM